MLCDMKYFREPSWMGRVFNLNNSNMPLFAPQEVPSLLGNLQQFV